MYDIKGRKDENAACHVMVEYADTLEEAIERARAAGVYDITNANLSRVREVYRAVSGEWFMATVKDTFTDEKTGKEKPLRYGILIQAGSFDAAYQRFKEVLKQGYDMPMVQIKAVKLDDVI